jgi:hypothetical protein
MKIIESVFVEICRRDRSNSSKAYGESWDEILTKRACKLGRRSIVWKRGSHTSRENKQSIVWMRRYHGNHKMI